jgi:Calcineurin-like phosphoesterase.
MKKIYYLLVLLYFSSLLFAQKEAHSISNVKMGAKNTAQNTTDAVIDNANSKIETDYTVPTWTVLQRTLTKATATNDPTDISILQTAIDSLKPYTSPYNVIMTFNGDPTSAMGFAWYTNQGISPGEVQLVEGNATTDAFSTPTFTFAVATTDLATNYCVTGNNLLALAGFPDNSVRSYTSHKATATGLKPNTTYSFRVGMAGAWSYIGSFTTAKTTKDPFSFIYFTDPQADNDSSFTVSKTTTHTAKTMFPDANFALTCGDLVETFGSLNSEWEYEQFFVTQQDIWNNTPLAPVVGNHDYSTNKNFTTHFNTASTGFDQSSATVPGSVYSFVYGDALFLAMNFQENQNADYLLNLKNWMIAQVAANPNTKWRIAFFHLPMYTGAGHQPDADEKIVRDYFTPLFDDLKIDLAMQGHDHVYEIIGPLKAKAVVPYSITNQVNAPIAWDNMTGKIGGTYNVLSGTLYFLNNTNGSKRYGPLDQATMNSSTNITATGISDYFSLFTGRFGQPDKPAFSNINVNSNFIKIATYTVNDAGVATLFDTIRIVKQAVTIPMNYRSKTSGNWNEATTWEYKDDASSTWTDATSAPDQTAKSITIQSGDTVTVIANTTAYATSSGLIINGNLNVLGTIVNTGVITSTSSTLNFMNGSLYRHAQNSGTVPAATWDTNSTCEIAGVTTTRPSGITNQSFGNFTWNCPNQTYSGSIGSGFASNNYGLPSSNYTVRGNLTIQDTGSGSLSFTTGVDETEYIAGNFNILSGNFQMLASGTNSNRTIIVGGNFTMNNGILTLGNGNKGVLHVAGDFSQSGGTINKGTSTITINFNKTGSQVYSQTGGTVTNPLNFEIQNGTTLTLNNNSTLILDSLYLHHNTVLNLSAGKQLTVNSSLTKNGEINLLSNELDGTATILTPEVIAGDNPTYTVQQFLNGAPGTSQRAWWYLSNPMASASTNVFGVTGISGSTNKMGYYNEPTTAYVQIGSGVPLTPGTGYATYLGGADATYTFSGTINNGNIPITVSRTGDTAAKRGFNLIGNPYPSYLDWNAVTLYNTANPRTDISSTIWYRTYGSGTMLFETFDGAIGTNNGGNGVVTQYIPPMQGFWMRVTGDNTSPGITFTNAMRSHRSQSSSGNRLRILATNDLQLLRLRVSNTVNNDEAIVVTDPDASNGYDNYDAVKMSNNNPIIPEIFTLAGSDEIVINHMNSISENTELALGFRPGQTNTFTLGVAEFNNFNGYRVILKDKLLNKELDLTDGTAYTFTSDATATNTRFTVAFKTSSVVTGNVPQNEVSAVVYKNDMNLITVRYNGSLDSESSVTVYNLMGEKLLSKQLTSSETVLPNRFAPGIYVVKVQTNGKTVVSKLTIN